MITWNEELESIRKKLKHYRSEYVPTKYLNVTNFLKVSGPHLNQVLGIPDLGLVFGKFVEIAGPESSGKSVQQLILMGMAQQQGASCLQIDAENSWVPRWVRKWGIDPKQVGLIQPYVGEFAQKQKKRRKAIETAKTEGRKINLRLATAEELCEEAECLMARMHERKPHGKIFLGIDSITSLLVGAEAEAGITGQNMSTNSALASFLSKLLRRWVGLAQSYNVLGVFINQLRTAPGVMYGDPEYTPGGKALKFYCQIRARMRRMGPHGGMLTTNGKKVGVRGMIINHKNKVGGIERSECGYKILFKGVPKYYDGETMRKDLKRLTV